MDTRTRKPLPQFQRQEWRNKPTGNSAIHKYSREFLLKNYQNLLAPQFPSDPEIQDIVLQSPNPPHLTAIFPFAHNLGEEVNSRKHILRERKPESMPEWYDEEEPKESIRKPLIVPETCEKITVKEEPQQEVKIVFTGSNVKNFEKIKDLEDKEIEERFTKIDLQVEEKLKNAEGEDDYEAPEWDEPTKEEFAFEPIKVVKSSGPVFDANLLRYHFAIGNPFVQILMDFGIPAGKSSVTYNLGTKPFEKIWFYKDLENNVQGPFSTLEMFTWTIRDCFPPDLEISLGKNTVFIPMNAFNEMNLVIEEPLVKKSLAKEPKTLEEIENLQSTMAGKAPQSLQVNPAIANPKTNESATLELKSFLGLLTK